MGTTQECSCHNSAVIRVDQWMLLWMLVAAVPQNAYS